MSILAGTEVQLFLKVSFPRNIPKAIEAKNIFKILKIQSHIYSSVWHLLSSQEILTAH